MNIFPLAGIATAFLVAAAAAQGADNRVIERLATCQDSWLEWKERDPGQIKNFSDMFQRDFSPKESGGAYIPRSGQTVAGLPVAQVYPQSVGMGVGFSVVVGANFDKTKKTLEQKIGRPLKCEPPSDNMRACELTVGEKKTVMLMAEDNAKSTTTLVGCYYFYAK